MTAYVNYRAVDEVFDALEMEGRVLNRLEALHKVEQEFAERLFDAYHRAAYELRSDENWSMAQISDELHVPVRQVPRMVARYAERSGKLNPLKTRHYDNVVDIRSLVRRASDRPQKSESTTHPTA